jgi:hypothetical protein
MKKFLLVAAAFVTLASYSSFADDLSMDTTALDKVGVAYSTEGTVALLGMIDNDGVTLTLNAGTYGASEPGAQALLGGGAATVEGTGGWLHYTAYGIVTQKIVVQKDADSPAGYVNDSLSVKINAMAAGGSLIATLGTGVSTYVPINSIAADLVTGISGTDTWTGVGDVDGAQVKYMLSGNPGVIRVDVLYTLTASI